jgi:hypothetical protein
MQKTHELLCQLPAQTASERIEESQVQGSRSFRYFDKHSDCGARDSVEAIQSKQLGRYKSIRVCEQRRCAVRTEREWIYESYGSCKPTSSIPVGGILGCV